MADTKHISGGRDPIRWTITTTNVELPDALLESIEDWCRLQRKRNREVDSMCNESDDQISAQDLEHEAARVSQGTGPAMKLQQEIANNTCRSIDALYDGQAVEGTGALKGNLDELMCSQEQASAVNPEGEAAYWRARAETAELKVLTFTEEIAKLRPAGSVGEKLHNAAMESQDDD